MKIHPLAFSGIAIRFFMLLIFSVIPYHAYGQCESIVRQGIFNSSLYASSSSYKKTVDDLIFSSDFRTHDEAISSGLSVGVPVFDVPIEIGGTFTTEQKETWKKKYLQTHTANVDKNAATQSFRSQADPNVLAAWLSCIEITNAQGLKAGIRPIGKNNIYFWIRYIPAGAADEPEIASIQLVGLKSNDSLRVGQKISMANGGIGSFYEVSGTEQTVAVNVTTRNPDRGGIVAQYNYGNYDVNVTKQQIDQALATAGFIVGEIRIFASGTIPRELSRAGWVECDGRSLPVSTYAVLHSVIGDAWGSNDVGISFKIPDLRGLFLRGWNHGAGRDPEATSRERISTGGASGDAVGSLQSSQVGPHDHPGQTPPIQSFSQGDSGGGSHMGQLAGGNPRVPSSDGRETRPVNVSVLYMIFTGVPQP